ncbi:hypothetical protein B4100_1912 [Heyndrickxia coagulans]|nr:hypothetical protein B4100_1912 [Heyndrickxia coagulans]
MMPLKQRGSSPAGYKGALFVSSSSPKARLYSTVQRNRHGKIHVQAVGDRF